MGNSKIQHTPHGENVLEVESPRSNRIKTLDQLLSEAKVDRKKWDVTNYVVNKWEVAAKDKVNGGMILQDLWQVKASLRRKTLKTSHPLIKPIRVERTKRSYTKKPERSRRAARAGIQTALLLPDPHFGFRRNIKTGKLEPFHDMRALDTVLQVAYELRPRTIVHMGDILDLAEWSDKFPRTPEFQQTTQPSILAANWWMGRLRDATPRARHVLLEGNHDRRMELAIVNHLKAAYDLRPADQMELPPALSIPRLLDVNGLGVEYSSSYPNGEFWLTPNLMCIHGTIARKGGGKTTSAIVKDYDVSIVMAHIHRVEQSPRTLFTGDGTKTIGAYSPGCLCHIDGRVPGVKARQDWQQGFGVAYYDEENSDVSVLLYEIRDGRVLFGGRLLTGDDRTLILEQDTGWNFH